MKKSVRLTEYTRFSGCAAKLGPGLLDRALCELQQAPFPELLVDYRHADDAGVWKINETTALVQTVDFFPPIVDDPFTFGRIAAANALSDVYAVGGNPITAMSIVGFPVDQADIQLLKEIMAGALDALNEAGAALVGGHSIKDQELKFGLSVTGLVHPHHILRNNSPHSGDVLILSKPIGTGSINCAHKAGAASSKSLEAAIASMQNLNKIAKEILEKFSLSACTDVTGFGLLGHACEMICSSGCGLRLYSQQVQTLPETKDYIAQGFVPGGTQSNREHREPWIDNLSSLSENLLNLLFDPQTSGGLLAAIKESQAETALKALQKAGVPAFSLGKFQAGQERITVELG